MSGANNLMRALLLTILIGVLAFCVPAQNVQTGFDLSNYGVKYEPDKRLIVVLSALEMAQTTDASGATVKLINTPLSVKGTKFREQLLQDNASLNDDLRRRISAFVLQYKKRNPQATDAELLTPFISMAYALTPPPELADPIITNDLPGSLLDVLDFAPLAREFYRRSTMPAKLDEYVKEYRAEADGVLRQSSREMVSQLLDYLHTRPQVFVTEKKKVETQKTNSKTKIESIEKRTHERHFNIVPEMLAAQGNVNFVNARDDYYVVLPPDKDVSFSEVRRAFLQFVVDPLVLENSKEIVVLRDWVKPKLDEVRKTNPNVSPDVILAISRSLAAAVDVRQAEYLKTRITTQQARQRIDTLKTDAEKRAVAAELDKYTRSLADDAVLQLSEDYDRGLVLSFFFADKLREIEQSGFDIAASLKDMLVSFDAAKESARVAAAADDRKRAAAAKSERKANTGIGITVSENPVTVRLREIQKTIDAKDYAKAAADLNSLLLQNPSEPRIYYNIGRVAGLAASATDDADDQAKSLVDAKDAYTHVLSSATTSTDPALLSLTYVALARIYEHFDRNDEAVGLYDKAIKLGEVNGGAFKDAMVAKQRLLKQP
jgi:tetratricopeptide (TPR) repeat protein